jgi:hypothetical protein
MTAGIHLQSGHYSIVEPWRERTPQAVLRQKADRIRDRIAVLYAEVDRCKGVVSTRNARRALIEAEHLCDLTADILRRDWLESTK